MWRIHRYYLREVATNATLTFTVLFGIVLLSLIYRGLDRAQGLGLLTAARTTLLLTANTIPHVLGMSFLLATVLSYARASQDREITALRAAGVSPRIALAPALLVGILLSVGGSFSHHYLLPAAHWYQHHGEFEVIREVILHSGLRSDRFAPPRTGFVMTWERRTGPSEFDDVFIQISRADSAIDFGGLGAGLFHSDRARIVRGEDDDTLALVLEGLREVGAGPEGHLDNLQFTASMSALASETRRDRGSVRHEQRPPPRRNDAAQPRARGRPTDHRGAVPRAPARVLRVDAVPVRSDRLLYRCVQPRARSCSRAELRAGPGVLVLPLRHPGQDADPIDVGRVVRLATSRGGDCRRCSILLASAPVLSF